VAQAPVVERAQVAPAVAQEYAAPLSALRAQLSALPRPKDVPKAQRQQDVSPLEKSLRSLSKK